MLEFLRPFQAVMFSIGSFSYAIVSVAFLANGIFSAGSSERYVWSLLADGLGTEQPCGDNAQSYR